MRPQSFVSQQRIIGGEHAKPLRPVLLVGKDVMDDAVAVHAKAPHPNAAALLFDFFLGEGQPLLAARNFVPSNGKVPSPFGDMPIKGIDSAEAIDKQDAWQKRYEEIFIRRR